MNEKVSVKRIYQIDLFRFLAALAVVLYHYLFRGYMSDNYSVLNFSEIGSYFQYGYLGVDMFFIISGFVITLSIKSRSLTDFCISRITRLYPSYWLGITITSLIIALYGAPVFHVNLKQILLNLTMFQNYINVDSVDGVYWSLFVEMKFYIFIIGAYLILNRIKEIDLNYLIYSWLLLAIVYVPLRESLPFKVLNYFLILNWSSYFIAGMIFYQIYKSGASVKYFALLCICVSISIFHAIDRIDFLESHYKVQFSPWYISAFIIVFYVLMLLISVGKLSSINSPKLIKMGLLTYPLYLIHQNIGYIIFNKFGNDSNKYVVMPLTIALMIVLSYIISTFYEPRVSGYIKSKLRILADKYLHKSSSV
jgi:peptidoglycan/LPS O-acetylase OafA/YrhL